MTLPQHTGWLENLGLAAAFLANGLYDLRRFWRVSFTRGARTRENLRARMAMDGHFLEYGLSLKDAAPGHGFERAERLATDIEAYIARFGTDSSTEIGLRMLGAWHDFAKAAARPLDGIAAVLARNIATGDLKGGVETVTAAAIRAAGEMDFLSFATARHSIRTYAPQPVPHDAIARAVRAAQQSPSSCNRQTCRVRLWTDPDLIRRILELQNGNRGFGEQLGGLAIITSDLGHWERPHERYQGWVDGGMFAMSFIYGLHAQGLGSVTLNWSVTRDRDMALRRLIDLPEGELVVTLVGFGCLPEDLRVPVSQRRPVDNAMSLNSKLVG